jgi:hypothetical protein
VSARRLWFLWSFEKNSQNFPRKTSKPKNITRPRVLVTTTRATDAQRPTPILRPPKANDERYLYAHHRDMVRMTRIRLQLALSAVGLASVIFVTSLLFSSNTLPPEQTPAAVVNAKTSKTLCKELVESYDDNARLVKILSLAQLRDPFDNTIPLPSSSLEPLPRCVGEKVVPSKEIFDVFPFGGGEVDTLEIRLFELYDVVDKFIAVISNVTHKGDPSYDILRPLLAENGRLARFSDKIEVFENHQKLNATAGIFQLEAEKEVVIARHLSSLYNDSTLVMFGHVDEIPAREDVWRAAHCDVKLPGNFAIWFPYGNVEYAFRSDHPAKNRPWSLGDPGVTVAGQDIRLPRGQFSSVLGRGFHATNYCFPPQVILKDITASEYAGFDPATLEKLKNGSDTMESCSRVMQEIREKCLQNGKKHGTHRYRSVTDLIKSGVDENEFYLPFALRQVPDRYPSWDPKGLAFDPRGVRAEFLM